MWRMSLSKRQQPYDPYIAACELKNHIIFARFLHPVGYIYNENRSHCMVKRFTISLLACSLLLLSGCGKKKDDGYPMNISEKLIEMTADGGEAEIELYHTNDWTTDNREQGWCLIDPTGGTGDGEPARVALTVTVSANPTPHVRNNIVTIRSGGEVKVLLITQDAAE